MNSLEHVVYQLRNAHVRTYPFPHFFVEEVFPWSFYRELRTHLPSSDKYHELSKVYAARSITDGNDHHPMLEAFETARFAREVLAVFGNAFYERYPNHCRPKFRSEFRFVHDTEGYGIGPHTDAPQKVLSLLFYLPETDIDFDTGTGIYVPTDLKKTCAGGPHYPFEGFEEAWRAPFVPNSCFGFWKTPNSWHAVEKISRKIERDVLLFNIYEESITQPAEFLAK
jgi:hypothetical protein